MIPVFGVPFTTGFNAVDCPPVNVVVVGLRATEMVGISAMVALAVFVGSTTLFAIKVMVCWVLSVAGTVYTPPAVTDPIVGVVQVIAVSLAPLIEAVNAADWPLVIEIQDGITEILTVGIRLTVAVSVATPGQVALIVTLLVAVIVAGAIYCPAAEMLPALGLIDQA